MRRNLYALLIGFPMLAALAAPAAAQFALDWYTVDGGGDMWTIGDDFELSGTIGQPDAGVVMIGDDFELVGGFWVIGAPPAGVCVGDLNCDGQVDFGDINPFVLRLSNPGGYAAEYPGCPDGNGDINGDAAVNFADINPFVTLMTTGQGPCP